MSAAMFTSVFFSVRVITFTLLTSGSSGMGCDRRSVASPLISFPSMMVIFSGYNFRNACKYWRCRCGDAGSSQSEPRTGAV
jgi:hypothetical protein